MASNLADLAIHLIDAQAYLLLASRDGLSNYDEFLADLDEAKSEVASLNEADSRELLLLLSDTATQLLLAHMEGLRLGEVQALLRDHQSRGWHLTRVERRGLQIPETVANPWAAHEEPPF